MKSCQWRPSWDNSHPMGKNTEALPLLDLFCRCYIERTDWHTHILHTNACLVGVLSNERLFLLKCFFRQHYAITDSHTLKYTEQTLAVSRSPLASSSCMHMSTTMGLLVLWALTSVVRSQLYTFLTWRRSGWQSLGTTLEHCLWTFKPQSDTERQIIQLVWSGFI